MSSIKCLLNVFLLIISFSLFSCISIKNLPNLVDLTPPAIEWRIQNTLTNVITTLIGNSTLNVSKNDEFIIIAKIEDDGGIRSVEYCSTFQKQCSDGQTAANIGPTLCLFERKLFEPDENGLVDTRYWPTYVSPIFSDCTHLPLMPQNYAIHINANNFGDRNISYSLVLNYFLK